jgi:hypothetical protein
MAVPNQVALAVAVGVLDRFIVPARSGRAGFSTSAPAPSGFVVAASLGEDGRSQWHEAVHAEDSLMLMSRCAQRELAS